MGKFRMLWFLLWHARCSDSLSWKMLVMMEGFAVYAGVKPVRARKLVMGLTEESPFLDQVPVGAVSCVVADEGLRSIRGWLSEWLRRITLKMQGSFDYQGNEAAEESCDG